jgi:ceramide glucosyltransferase
MLWALAGVLGCLLAGSLAYCLLSILAARDYLRVIPPAAEACPPVSVLKPLSGADDGLEENLRSFFEQDYPAFEILFAVRRGDDPAVPVVMQLQREYKGVDSQLIVTGDPPYPNAKVYSLERMAQAARFELLAMSDSDIRVERDFLRRAVAEFEDERTGVASCPYRAVPGRSFWSLLEALGMNTEFLSGVLTARWLEGMKFALGPTIIARRQAMEAIGGFGRLKDYLAEDFVLGKLAAEAGWKVILSRCVIEHRIGAQDFRRNVAHRLRWFRSTRRSRPAGYAGQVFTHPIPLGLLLAAVWPSGWTSAAVALAAAMRAASAWSAAGWVLADPLTARYWYLLPLQDGLSFLFWLAGFFGDTIVWRGRKYRLRRDGTFEALG